MKGKIYRGMRTTRYHTDPLLTRVNQTNADHSWGVVYLITCFHPNPSANLLRAAITHDCAEFQVGDVPGPVKSQDTYLKDHLDLAETRILDEAGMLWVLTRTEEKWIKWADCLEACLFMYTFQPNYMDREDWRECAAAVERLSEELGVPGTLRELLDEIDEATNRTWRL